MIPPDQCLAADERAVPHVHLGLEIGIEFALGQGDLQPSFQFALQQRFLPHLLVVKDNVLHRLLGVPARVVGKIQHAVQIEPFRLVHQIDTEHRDDPVRHVLHTPPLVQFHADFFYAHKQGFPVGITHQQDEVVRRCAGTAFPIFDVTLQDRAEGPQDLIAHGETKVVVDRLELIDIPVEQGIASALRFPEQLPALHIELVHVVEVGQPVPIQQGLYAMVAPRLDGEIVDQQQQDHPENRQHPAPDLNKVLGHEIEQRDLAGLGGVLQHQLVHPFRGRILDALIQYGEQARVRTLGNAETDFARVLAHARGGQGFVTAFRKQIVGHIDVRVNRIRVALEQRIETFPYVLVKNDFLAWVIRRHMLREPVASLQGNPFDGVRLLGPHKHGGRPQIVTGGIHLVALVPEVIPRYGADHINKPFLDLFQRFGLIYRLKTETQTCVS